MWQEDDRVVSLFFFFSSRRRHTRLQGDWSSDVCSSDLAAAVRPEGARGGHLLHAGEGRARRGRDRLLVLRGPPAGQHDPARGSGERRVGEEWRSPWAPYPLKKKKTNTRHMYIAHDCQPI